MAVDDLSEVVTAYDTRRPRSRSPYLRLTNISIYLLKVVRYLVFMYIPLVLSTDFAVVMDVLYRCCTTAVIPGTNIYQVVSYEYVGPTAVGQGYK